MSAHTRRSLLLPLFLLSAACGLARAQAPTVNPDSGARSASPSSPNPTPPAAGRTGPATDTQPTDPTAAECARLRAEQPGLNSGGTLNADMKAKLDQCRQAQARGAAPR